MTASSTDPLRSLFEQPDLLLHLARLDDAGLDQLPLGVIAFDRSADARVVRYNVAESRFSGLSTDRVIGQPLFELVAPCMNNYLVAQRFDDTLADQTPLDETLDYVFTLRMRPTPVVLRLLFAPDVALRYVVVLRQN